MKGINRALGVSIMTIGSISACAQQRATVTIDLSDATPSEPQAESVITLSIPRAYLFFASDLSGGRRQVVTLEVWLSDMQPAMPRLKAVQASGTTPHDGVVAAQKESDKHAASVALTFDQDQSLLPRYWKATLDSPGMKRVGVNDRLKMEEFVQTLPRMPPKRYFWAEDIHAYAQCDSDSGMCKISAYLADGIYADVILSIEYLPEARRMCSRLAGLVRSFVAGARSG
jgi:hypothetical protein